jgi:hypothetical protein
MRWFSDLWRYGFTAEQRHATRAAERYAEAIRAYERELAQIPLTEARARAEDMPAAATQVRVTPADQSAALQLDHLAPAGKTCSVGLDTSRRPTVNRTSTRPR